MKLLLAAFAALSLLSLEAAAQSRFVVTSPADSGPGSLREAVVNANGNADRSTIDFAIDSTAFGPGPWTIRLASNLPAFTAPVLLRGYSQPGSTQPTSTGNGRPLIEIDTDGGATSALVFVRGAEASVVTGLSFIGGSAPKSAAALLLLADDVRVSSSFIGVRADGTLQRYANQAIGAVCADRVVIGGSSPADGNVIGGADGNAILLTGSGHVVQHNWIGIDGMGAASLSSSVFGDGLLSGRIGLLLQSSSLQNIYPPAVQQSYFGLRDALIADNRFGSVTGTAIHLLGTNNPTSGNRIERNVFGRDLWLGSSAHVDTAVRLSNGASDNRIGDNIVARVNAGVLLGDARQTPPTEAGSGNRLSGNLFYEVAFPLVGLDAAHHFAPLANDPGDADSGPNGLQNTPVLTAASAAGGLEGVLDAVPDSNYRIEFFLAAACHASGGGGAEFLLGALDVVTDGSGRAAIATRLSQLPLGGLRVGDVVSAIATDSAGNSSEFSNCVRVEAPVATRTDWPVLSSPRPAMDTTLKIEARVGGNGMRTPTGEVVFSADTASGRRELGRVRVNGGGSAVLRAPPLGFFVNGGRYTLNAEYSGDAFHAPSAAATQTLVIFRPAIALRDIGLSAPVRRDIRSNKREFFDARSNSWSRLNADVSDSYVDADRFNRERTDQVLLRDSGGAYALLDANGRRQPLASREIDAGATLLDLLQMDDDVRADAIVRDSNGRYRLVHCAFVPDSCERSERLSVNVEFTYLFSGDFNGDGFADLAWRNPSSGEIELWLMNGTARPLGIERVRLGLPNAVLSAAADVNGDGYEDLIWIDDSSSYVIATLMDAGRARNSVLRILPGKHLSTPGSTHLALASEADFGFGHVWIRDEVSGDVQAWRDPRASSTLLSYRVQPIFATTKLALERTR
ncbi:VCBS repeat protein [Tahibacter aquaticus]|uniref:VCBS repeat protein n=1 Tax=Tahibacter aquaticus TaxID=520092 RepID=A0A4R6YRV5_9GAMM|nr:Ig-like domain repeat protein [Tahibacter aquaticus]TDR40857.1 VCBS repeat protein [Tahibacter aquaticus]